MQQVIHLFVFVFVLTAGFFAAGRPACAASPIGTATFDREMPATCDAEFMQSMESRAWLEAQREVTQNQNLIYKQDSVLEYTCFDSALNHLALAADDMFSDNVTSPLLFNFPPILFFALEATQPTIIIGPPSSFAGPPAFYSTLAGPDPPGGALTFFGLDEALTSLVGESLDRYIETNFGHTFLGGRSSVDHDPPPTVLGDPYECERMNEVWFLAKCTDFQEGAQDAFFQFTNYATTEDKRILPEECDGEPRWQAMLDTALLEPPWQEEGWEYETYLEPLTECFDPVPTGVTVTLNDGATFPDAVCTAPGCFYDRGACRAQ